MSPVDALTIIILCAGGLWGFLRGAIRQITSFLGWTAAIVLPYFFSGSVGHIIANEFDAPYPIALLVAGILLGLIGQVLARFLFFLVRRITRRLFTTVTNVGKDEKDKEKAKEERFEGGLSDSILGGLIGGGKWVAIIWVLLSAVALVVKPLHERGYTLGVEKSEAFKLSEQHNALGLLWKQDFKKLEAAIQRIQSAKRATNEKVQASADALAKDDRIRKVMADPKLRNALHTGDVRTLLESPELLSLVTDTTVMEHAFTVGSASMGTVTSGHE